MKLRNRISVFAASVMLVVAMTLSFASPLYAAPGNAENGKALYMKKCWWCHGEEGEADGPGAEFMQPPPRDFTFGVYKYKTSPPDVPRPRDEDLFGRITNGMPGTSMPSWKEVLNDQERWDLVAYIKTLTDLFEDQENPPAISYASKIPSSPESIEKGKKAFEDAKCFECHGATGKGNMMKKLKEDGGARVWPRNFYKKWTFRVDNTPEAIFTRVTNGIPNTPMKSFAAETTGDGKLSEEDRWHVANYVSSLADENRRVQEGEIVIKGSQVEDLPADENDPAWDAVSSTAFRLIPQIIQKERFFIPSNDMVMVKSLFSADEVALLIEWDDRTKSVVGDATVEALSFDGLSPDALAVQFPVTIPTSLEKPYFGHGDSSHPVSMLYWNSGSVDQPNNTMMLTTTGSGSRQESDAAAAGFVTSASYKDGTWKVMMKRKLTTPDTEKDIQFVAGKYIPIAFANWDGSNGEKGSRHTMTTWYWLLLQPETGSQVVTYPVGAFFLLVAGQFLFAAYLRKSN